MDVHFLALRTQIKAISKDLIQTTITYSQQALKGFQAYLIKLK